MPQPFKHPPLAGIGRRLSRLLLGVAVVGLAACAAGGDRRPAAAPEPTPLPAGNLSIPGEATGTLGGAAYRFEVPANWNGELVLYLHGYEPSGTPRSVPLLQDDFDRWLLANGFAVARSAYRTQGWAVAEAMEDNERLRQHVLRQLPGVKHTWLIGQSMGGHLVLATLERHGEAYAGGLSLCGVNAPAEEAMRDGVMAPLVVAEALLPGLFGEFSGGLADPAAPPALDEALIERALLRNRELAEQIAQAFGIRREDLAGALMLRYVVLRELIPRSGGFPLDNRDVRYAQRIDVPEIDSRVRRYEADPVAAAYLRQNFELQGKPDAPVVIQSNVYDPTVPEPFASRYVELAASAGRSDRVHVQPPVGEGHCAFDVTAVDRAFKTLRDWTKP
ncbi:MAG: alpha/beta hydrolase family protein [Aquimonas sp.]